MGNTIPPSSKPALLTAVSLAAGVTLMAGLLHWLNPHWHWANLEQHATIEAVGALAALMLAYLLLRPFQANRWNTTGVALGLIALGLGDGLHAMVAPGQSFVFLKSVPNLAGALGFALSWVPLCERSFGCRDRAALSTVALMVVLGIWGLAFSDRLPVMVENGAFTLIAVGMNALAGLLYLVAAARFALDYVRTPNREMLAYMLTALLFALGSLFFPGSMLWDHTWWFWHLLRLAAYLIVLWLVLETYLEAERTLKASERKYRVVADNTHDWEYWTDSKGAFLYSSPSCVEVTGRDAEAFLRQPSLLEEIIHPDDRRLWTDHKRDMLDSHERGALEFRIILPDGNDRWIGHVCRPVLDGDGRVVGRRGSNRDITEHKRAEDALIHAKEAADRANRAKSAFLANMSHEIRTPLNGVQGFLQLLGTSRLEPEQAEYVELAMESSRSLLTVINDILDFSKIEADKLAIAHEPFDLDALVRSAVKTFDPVVAAKGIALHAQLGPGIDTLVVGDAARLRQVLFNLIGNAIKFTERGEVRLEVGLLERVDGEWMRLGFVVSDTGIGIPANRLADLFQPFTQVDSSSTRRFQGTGLGLAIVKRLVGLMDGQVEIHSDPGSGTKIRFDIKVGIVAHTPMIASAATSASQPTGEAAAQALRVLVVDDEPANAKLLTIMLKRQGHSVATASNGRQALQALAGQRFDLVLMDVSMPEMDGIEATRRIRENAMGDLDASIPIVALTAHALTGDRERFLAAGMDDYLFKPIDAKALRAQLHEIGSRKAGAS